VNVSQPASYNCASSATCQ